MPRVVLSYPTWYYLFRKICSHLNGMGDVQNGKLCLSKTSVGMSNVDSIYSAAKKWCAEMVGHNMIRPMSR